MGSLRALLRLWVKAAEKRQVPARSGRMRRLCLEAIEERRMLSAVPLDLSRLSEVGSTLGTMSHPTDGPQSPRIVVTTMIAGGTISFPDFYPLNNGILPPVNPGDPPGFRINPELILIKNPTSMPKRSDDAAPPAKSEQDAVPNQGGAIPLETVGDESRGGDENKITNQLAMMPVIPKETQATLRSATSDTSRPSGGVTGEVARAIVIETETVATDKSAAGSSGAPHTTSGRNLNRYGVETRIHEAANDFLDGLTLVSEESAFQGEDFGAASKPSLTHAAVELDGDEDTAVPQSSVEESMVDSVPALLGGFAKSPLLNNAGNPHAPVLMDAAETTNRPWVEYVQAVGRVFSDFGSRDGVLEISGLLLAISMERGVAAERRRRNKAKTAVTLHKESH